MSQSTSQLLSLPTELRLQIWSHALTSPICTLYFDSDTNRFDLSSIGAGLLTACRQTYHETRWLPVQLNEMVIGIPEDASKELYACLEKLKRLKKDWESEGKGREVKLSVGLVRERGWDRD
jgi:hypothetical protein